MSTPAPHPDTIWSLQGYRAMHPSLGLRDVLNQAWEEGYLLGKYAEPEEDARRDLHPEHALDVAREDPGLVFLYRPGARMPWEILGSAAGREVRP